MIFVVAGTVMCLCFRRRLGEKRDLLAGEVPDGERKDLAQSLLPLPSIQ